MSVPPFLAVLGLADDPALDERALRRAYAKRLKQIDVEADPAGFQALREALENAVRWCAWRAKMAEAKAAPAEAVDVASMPEPVPVPAPASTSAPLPPPPAPAAPVDFHRLGEAAFADFAAAVAPGLADTGVANEALQRALADERLVNVDAWRLFETRVALLLANGWRPGHEALLPSAGDVFGWQRDHARLRQLGPAGAMLAAAFAEGTAFELVPAPKRASLALLLACIRDDQPFPASHSVTDLWLLAKRLPTWLRVVAPIERVEQRYEAWRQAARTPPPDDPAAAYGIVDGRRAGPPPTPRKSTRAMPGRAWIVGLSVAGAMLASLFGNHDAPVRRPVVDQTAIPADLARRQADAEALLQRIDPGPLAAAPETVR